MSSFVKSKKKNKKTLIILTLLNFVLSFGILGIHHWYIGSIKKTLYNFVFITGLFGVFQLFISRLQESLFDPFEAAPTAQLDDDLIFLLSIILLILPTIFELIMVGLFPNSAYYEDIEWIDDKVKKKEKIKDKFYYLRWGIAITSLILILSGSITTREENYYNFSDYTVRLTTRENEICRSARSNIDSSISVDKRVAERQCSNLITNRDFLLCADARDKLAEARRAASRRYMEPCIDAQAASLRARDTFETEAVMIDGERLIMLEELSTGGTVLVSSGFLGFLTLGVYIIRRWMKSFSS